VECNGLIPIDWRVSRSLRAQQQGSASAHRRLQPRRGRRPSRPVRDRNICQFSLVAPASRMTIHVVVDVDSQGNRACIVRVDCTSPFCSDAQGGMVPHPSGFPVLFSERSVSRVRPVGPSLHLLLTNNALHGPPAGGSCIQCSRSSAVNSRSTRVRTSPSRFPTGAHTSHL
jgi:hypothetical protein